VSIAKTGPLGSGPLSLARIFMMLRGTARIAFEVTLRHSSSQTTVPPAGRNVSASEPGAPGYSDW